MFVVPLLLVASTNGGNSRFRYLGGSLYPDITAREIAVAYGNCKHTICDTIGRPYSELERIIIRLAPRVYFGDEWQRFMENKPPGIFTDSWADGHPLHPAQVHVPPATRLLLGEILSCVEEMWHTTNRLSQELDSIFEIMSLVHPLEFARLLLLSTAKDSEFVRQQELVKKWVNPGAEAMYIELSERGNSLAADGWRVLQSAQEAGATHEVIGIGARGEKVICCFSPLPSKRPRS